MICSRNRLRNDITDAVLADIIEPSGLEQMLGAFHWGKDEPGENDSFSSIRQRLQRQYKEASIEEIRFLKDRIYKSTDLVPKYSPAFSWGIFWTLRYLVSPHFFRNIKVTGSIDRVLEVAREHSVVVLPPHFDMLDPLVYDYIFMHYGQGREKKPLVFHMGLNLGNNFLDTALLPRGNGYFMRRSQDELDQLIYADSVQKFMERGWSQGVFIEGTRSRDLKIAPSVEPKERHLMERKMQVKPMKRGFVSALLNANRIIDRKIYVVKAVHNAPFFPDVVQDYQKELLTGKKKDFSTLRKLTNVRFYKSIDPRSGIFVHFEEPYELPKHGLHSFNTNANRVAFVEDVRKTFKEKTTVLPENLFAYTMRYAHVVLPEYITLSPEEKREGLEKLYLTFAGHLNSDSSVLLAPILKDEPRTSFTIGADFYRDLSRGVGLPPILEDDFSLNYNILVETASNRIQHFLKEYPILAPGTAPAEDYRSGYNLRDFFKSLFRYKK